MAANNWIPIQTISGAATEYSFTSIPAGYKSLILKGNLQSATTGYTQEFYLRCNGDTGYNYQDSDFGYQLNTTSLRTNGAQSVSGGTGGFVGASYLGDWGSHVEIHMFGVDNTDRYTTWAGTSAVGGGANGYNVTMFGGGIWQNTASITQIDTLSLNANANSTLTLYGRK